MADALDRHFSQLIKCFRIGEANGQRKRIRESFLGAKAPAPMNLTIKDHRPTDPVTGLPKTRTLINGN